MESNDYVSYELAKKIHDTDFDLDSEMYYYFHSWMEKPRLVRHTVAYAEQRKFDGTDIYPAPTLYAAQKWLREKWRLHISANPLIPSLYWAFFIDDLNQYINPQDGELMSRWTEEMQEEESNRPGYDSYESALSAGIEAALELIKEKET